MRTKFKSLILIASLFFTNQVFSQAVITVFNSDAANVGFNDKTPIAKNKIGVGGNFATTLGQARLNALQFAVNKISNKLNSSVEIDFITKFADMASNGNGTTLAATRVASFHANFVGAPRMNTLYHSALANKINGNDLNVNGYDLSIEFNGAVDVGALGTRKWYYGFDAKPKNGDIDFVTVSTHEILHGLGFSAAVNPISGEKGQIRRGGNFMDDVYMLNLEHHGATQSNYSLMTNNQRAIANKSNKLHWVGAAIRAKANGALGFQNGHAVMYAPSTVQPGSSVSHFSTLFSSVTKPGEMMEPGYTGADHDIGLAAQVLEDIGWGKLNSNSNRIDLVLEVTNPSSNPTIGSNEVYSIIVTNNGTAAATGIVVTNFLPVNSTFVSAIPASSAACDNTNVAANKIVSCYLASLPASGTAIFNITVKTNASILNSFSANVESLNPDTSFLNNNSVSKVAAIPEQAPVISPLTDQVIEVGQTVNLAITAQDPNGDKPTISLVTAILGSTFTPKNDGTATFTWAPTASNVGDNPISFKATDTTNRTDSITVIIKVTAKPDPGTGGGGSTGSTSGISNNNVNTGGCSINTSAKFDPLIPVLLIMLSIWYLIRRINIACKSY